MSLQLHCTKAKIFHRINHTSEQHVSCARGVKTSVPDWVKDTLGYKMGIKDESIVDLTPPRAAVAVPAKEAEKRPTKADAAKDDEAPEPDASADEGGEAEDAVTDEEAAEEEAAQQPARRAAASRVPKGIVSASTVVKTK